MFTVWNLEDDTNQDMFSGPLVFPNIYLGTAEKESYYFKCKYIERTYATMDTYFYNSKPKGTKQEKYPFLLCNQLNKRLVYWLRYLTSEMVLWEF